MRKQRFITLSFSLILIFNLIFAMVGIVPAGAAENTVKSIDKKLVLENTGSAVSDGKYIYYAYQGDGKRMGIIKLDLTSFKQKVIAKPVGNSFTNLSIKGNYIYAVLDKVYGYGRGNGEPYIYRISKDGKNKKKLAVGKSPVIIGNKIYYFSGKIVKLNDKDRGIENLNDFEIDGYVSSMDLDGKNKKKVAKVSAKNTAWIRLFKSGNKIYYENENSRISDLAGNIVKESDIVNTGEINSMGFTSKYSYDVKTKLQYHKLDKYGEDKLQEGIYKGGKWNYKTLAKFHMILQASVFDNYIITKVFEQQKSEELLCKVYLLDKKGKVLKELDSFVPAE